MTFIWVHSQNAPQKENHNYDVDRGKNEFNTLPPIAIFLPEYYNFILVFMCIYLDFILVAFCLFLVVIIVLF